MTLLEALLSPLALLVYPAVIPVPALLVLVPTAWGIVRWERRRRKAPVPRPLFVELWAWWGWGVVALFGFIAVGLATMAWQPAVILAAWLVGPLAVISRTLVRAGVTDEAR